MVDLICQIFLRNCVISNAYENNEFVEIPGMEAEIKNHVEYAKLTFLKNKRINIRISQKELF